MESHSSRHPNGDWSHRLVDLVFYAKPNDQPDDGAAQRNLERIRMVIKARWVCLGLMGLYGIYLGVFFSLQSEIELSTSQLATPVGTLGFAVLYNGWYHYSCRWWRTVRVANQLQLIFDLLVITVLVHFSGGVLSWFWAMYLLVTLEATFLLHWPGVTGIGIFGMLLYGGLLTAEFYSIIPPVDMPLEDGKLQHNFTYEMITWGWVSVMNTAIGLVGLYLMGVIRHREAALAESLEQLKEAKVIIDRDLQRARQIQGSLLPLEDLPVRGGLQVGARMIPAREIGGDYYDYIADENGLWVAIGDVSGKGVQAGLLMAIARTILRSVILQKRNPVDVLTDLGTSLSRDMPPGFFMSFLLLYWDREANMLHCAGAGHENIIVYRQETKQCDVYRTGGTALGVMKDTRTHLSSHELYLGPQDFIVLYSDGATEAQDPNGDFFTLDRLVRAVTKVASKTSMPPREVVSAVIEQIDLFRQGRDLPDDLTVLVLGHA